MNLKHFFLPHPDSHRKAHLISTKALLVYIAFFITLQLFFNLLTHIKPGVLGIVSQVTKEEIIDLVNKEREKRGFEPLVEDKRLSVAAQAKGMNMLEENYWAHYSPSGKDPWLFITNSGYKFSYAGENLAKNFYKSDEVIAAWMASQTHRDNLLSPRYQNIGIAVIEGVLNGQKTTLIVQEFGSPVERVALAQPKSQKTLTAKTPQPQVRGETLDPYLITKSIGFFVLSFIAVIITIDLLSLKKRAVFSLSSRHLPHLALLSLALASLINLAPGEIL